MNETGRVRSEAEWRAGPGPGCAVCRRSVAESSFSGKRYRRRTAGACVGIACRGAPSGPDGKLRLRLARLFAAANPRSSGRPRDDSHGMRRIESGCVHCGARLGCLFPDVPGPAGLRYSISASTCAAALAASAARS